MLFPDNTPSFSIFFLEFKKIQISGSVEENNLGGRRNSRQQISVLLCCKCLAGVKSCAQQLSEVYCWRCYLHLQNFSFDHQHCFC